MFCWVFCSKSPNLIMLSNESLQIHGFRLLLDYITASSYDCSIWDSVIMVTYACGLSFGPEFGNGYTEFWLTLSLSLHPSQSHLALDDQPWSRKQQWLHTTVAKQCRSQKQWGRASPIRIRSLFILCPCRVFMKSKRKKGNWVQQFYNDMFRGSGWVSIHVFLCAFSICP